MEVYGFVSWIVSFISMGLWVIWAYVPENMLHFMGISLYPSKYWAIAAPMSFCSFVLIGFISYNALSCLISPPINSFSLIRDSHSRRIPDYKKGRIPPVGDIPISTVNRVLFHKIVLDAN
eukprot:GHVL01010918.1.p1 GENE.GHVL01010918.1~~GHVL01010918.1.p1  ORF type:complete len:138 (-),score=5.77 GHVL01010918.1:1080-1439(-)